MINWHSSACRRPDVMFLDDIGTPSCLNCGEVGTIAEASSASAPNKPPETPQRASFELCWPASLPFIDDVPDNNGSTEQSKPSSSAASIPRGAVVTGETPAVTDVREGTTAAAKTSLYEPLYARKIRILQLLPGNYHDPICCKIQTVDLQSRPEYEALSYTWADSTGDTSLSQSIYFGDRHDILPITANCANALRRLRFPYRSRALWVDSICIDQDNIQERSHQVGIMQYIYATAERVLIYLGEDEADPDPATCVPWQYENRGNTLELSTDLRKQPYFTRTWVIQEVASARSAWILLGSKGARWADILKPPAIGDANYRPLCIENYNLLKARHPWLQLVAQPKHRDLSELWDLLYATVSCQASDPRDKVFALLGLFIGSNDAGLVPDYSLSLCQVLTGVTAFIFGQYPKLLLQIFALAIPTSLQSMPSWVVDWSNPLTAELGSTSLEPPSFASPRGESRESANETAVRFYKDGSLVVKGIPLLSLSDFYFTNEPEGRPPGLMKGFQYKPFYEMDDRKEQLQTSGWAREGDKVYAVAGLYDKLLVLRPLECTNKQTFVGICESINDEFSEGLVNLQNQGTALLFSTWNDILDHRTEDWFIPQAWNEVRNVCRLIRKYSRDTPSIYNWTTSSAGSTTSPCRRQQGFDNVKSSSSPIRNAAGCKSALLKFGKDLGQEQHRRDQLHEGHTKPQLEKSYTLCMTSNVHGRQDQPEFDLADFLLPACWQFGQFGTLIDPSLETSRQGRMFSWRPGYMNSEAVKGFWPQLGSVLQSEISYHASGYDSASSFLQRLIGQKLTHKFRDFDALMRYYQAGRCRSPCLNHEEQWEDAKVLRWIRNSMEISPDNNWKPEWHFNNLDRKTWVEKICDILGLLAWRSERVSYKPPSSTVFDGNSEEEGVITGNFDEAIDVGGWTLDWRFESKAWDELWQLADYTERCLLPLEEAFTTPRGVATCADKTNDIQWEDVSVV